MKAMIDLIIDHPKAVKKFFVAVATAASVAAVSLTDGTYTVVEGLQTVVAVLGAFGVYAVRNG